MDGMRELIIFLIIMVAVLLLVSQLKQQQVLQIFAVVFLLHGVGCIVIPSFFGNVPILMLNGKPDDLHIFLLRFVGICCLSLAATIYLNHKSPDAYTRVSLFFGIFLLSVLSFFIHFLREASADNKDSKGVTFKNGSLLMAGGLGFAVICAFCVLMAKDFFGHSQLHSRLNMHLMADFIMSLVFGVILFAYPKLLLGHLSKSKSFDEVQVTLAQAYGSYCISSGTLSLLYISVLFTVNKRHLMMCKVLETLGLAVLVLVTNFANESLGGSVQITLLLFGLLSFNALLGYYSPHETAGYISKDE